MTYTMPEILMAIAAIGVVLNSAIRQWRDSTKIDQTAVRVEQAAVSTEVILGHVNSKETKYVEQLAAKDEKIAFLERAISDKDATAALLAQAQIAVPRTVNVTNGVAVKPADTAKTDATVTELKKES